MVYSGRKLIQCDDQVITVDNVASIVASAMPTHKQNQSDIKYLWNYYKGTQPILDRKKPVRPEINNKVIENRANEIVSFKTGYLMGEPVQYVSRSGGELTDEITTLNEYMFSEEKASKDKELADWFHICGTAYRMVLPDEEIGEPDESPFEIYVLDPRNTFVIYTNDYKKRPLLGVTYYMTQDGTTHYYCYSDTFFFEVVNDGLPEWNGKVKKARPHLLGGIPIIEYPLNMARLGAFEIVLSLIDAINLNDSDRLNAVEQFVSAIMVFYNVDISGEDFERLRSEGALKVQDIDPQMKAKIEYLVNNLSQEGTQKLTDHLYDTILTICGMPNRQMGSTSTSDNVGSVIMRDGWSAAEARAKDTEAMFKKSERQFIRIVLTICDKLRGLSLKQGDIEIRFTRRNYENILQKAQVLDIMLKNGQIAKKLAFEHCGMFVDPDLAYLMSEEDIERTQKLEEEESNNNAEGQIDTDGIPSGVDSGDSVERQPS